MSFAIVPPQHEQFCWHRHLDGHIEIESFGLLPEELSTEIIKQSHHSLPQNQLLPPYFSKRRSWRIGTVVLVVSWMPVEVLPFPILSIAKRIFCLGDIQKGSHSAIQVHHTSIQPHKFTIQPLCTHLKLNA